MTELGKELGYQSPGSSEFEWIWEASARYYLEELWGGSGE